MSDEPSVWRRWCFRLCGVVFVLGLVTSTIAIWANVRIQESDAWAEMVSPLADNPAIREYVVDRASVTIDQRIGADENAGRFQRSARTQLSDLAQALLREFVESDQFPQWWTNANLETHRTLVKLESGENAAHASIVDDAIVLDMQPMVDWLNTKLTEYVPALDYQITIDNDGAYLTLYRADALRQVSTIAAHLDTWAVVLPIVTLLALVGALAAARDRLAAIGQIALGTAIGTGLTIAALYFLLRWLVMHQAEPNQDAIAAFLRIILNDLALALRAITIGSLALAAILAIVRSHLLQDSRFPEMMRSYRNLVVGAKISVALLYIVLAPNPNVWISAVAVLLILWGCFDVLCGQRSSQHPSR